jgi:macrophage erythroblast attacher
MSEDNPPLVLPSGAVYSSRGVERLIEAAAQGAPLGAGQGGPEAAAAIAAAAASLAPGSWGVCPVSGVVFRREELRRAYIA